MRFIAYILMLISTSALAQLNGDWIESGQMKLRVNADGQMATFNNNSSSEFIAGSNNHLFKFINLWISAYDNANKLHITSVNGFSNKSDKSDYSPGPLNNLTFISAEPDSWNYVWPVTANEIKEHRKNFKNSNYIVSDALKNWPSMGGQGYNDYLAPFIDYDQNEIYEPSKGDYPDIIGEKACYFIVNDNHHEHKASFGQPLRIEIYGMAYSLASLPNSVFVKYYIINRTDSNFNALNISFHSGFQLGNDKDNYCGTVVSKNMVFAYNGDSNDDNHFGTGKPLASLMILNKELSSSIYITNDADINSGMPATDQSHRNMMEGKWKTSNPLTFGNDGKGSSPVSKFVYPGTTDPSFSGQNWQENAIPGERSLLANMSYQSLSAKGGYIELDIAISGFDKSDGDPYSFLEKKATEIKTAWSEQVSASVKKPILEEFVLKNPIQGGENIYQNWFKNFKQISIYNALGQIVKQIEPNVENTLIIKQSGIYYISLKTDNQIITKKILIL